MRVKAESFVRLVRETRKQATGKSDRRKVIIMESIKAKMPCFKGT